MASTKGMLFFVDANGGIGLIAQFLKATMQYHTIASTQFEILKSYCSRSRSEKRP